MKSIRFTDDSAAALTKIRAACPNLAELCDKAKGDDVVWRLALRSALGPRDEHFSLDRFERGGLNVFLSATEEELKSQGFEYVAGPEGREQGLERRKVLRSTDNAKMVGVMLSGKIKAAPGCTTLVEVDYFPPQGRSVEALVPPLSEREKRLNGVLYGLPSHMRVALDDKADFDEIRKHLSEVVGEAEAVIGEELDDSNFEYNTTMRDAIRELVNIPYVRDGKVCESIADVAVEDSESHDRRMMAALFGRLFTNTHLGDTIWNGLEGQTVAEIGGDELAAWVKSRVERVRFCGVSNDDPALIASVKAGKEAAAGVEPPSADFVAESDRAFSRPTALRSVRQKS